MSGKMFRGGRAVSAVFSAFDGSWSNYRSSLPPDVLHAAKYVRTAILGIVLGSLIASLAHGASAINLAPFETECRDEIMANQCPAGENCYQLWKPIKKCAFTRAYGRGWVSEHNLDDCIRAVDTNRRKAHLCTACGSREIDQQILSCLSE